MIRGRATAEGTGRYRRRFVSVADGHFRVHRGLELSSIGLGSYLGDADDATDRGYEEAVAEALRLGANVIDTAINYRHQRSERAIGRALAKAVDDGVVARDEVFISTKGGFLPFDGELPADPPGYLRATFVDSGLVSADDLAAGCHAMTPAYLEDQLTRSRANLGVETIDLYYLHNPETQLGENDRGAFDEALGAALEWLEAKVTSGEIGAYGLATWNAFRVAPEAADAMALEEVAAKASAAGGAGLAAVQLPLNLGMPEALAHPSQVTEDVTVPFLTLARKHGLAVFTSASILQGRLARGLPAEISAAFPGLETDAQRALQFSRSAPGVTTALVGMADADHVRENLALADVEPAGLEAFRKLFTPGGS